MFLALASYKDSLPYSHLVLLVSCAPCEVPSQGESEPWGLQLSLGSNPCHLPGVFH